MLKQNRKIIILLEVLLYTMKPRVLYRERSEGNSFLDLPKNRWLGAYVQNIRHAIKEIRNCGIENAVVGYSILRGPANIEGYHEIIPLEVAKEKSKADKDYRFMALEELLKRQSEINSEKYEINSVGRIVGLNPNYDT